MLGDQWVGPGRRRDDGGAARSGAGIGLTGAIAVSTDFDHSCALLGDGTVWCWGDNQTGSRGDGTNTNRLVPTAVRW
ncbi:MAG TPA: hypothetical protein VHK47_11460 [Polyangia bacterium]|nr:hypothetical protein [Polyangia bacterium]